MADQPDRKDGEMTRGARRAVIFLFFLSAAFSAVSYFSGIHYYNSSQAAQQRSMAQIDRKICADVGIMVRSATPAERKAWTRLLSDLGCSDQKGHRP